MSRRAITLWHHKVELQRAEDWRYRDLLENPPTEEDAAEALAPIRQLRDQLGQRPEPPPIPLIEEAWKLRRARYRALPDGQRRCLERDRARIAMHEAGHAVVDEAEGLSAAYIEISPQRNNPSPDILGSIQGPLAWPHPGTEPEVLLCMARRKLGGWAGDALYLGAPELAEVACSVEAHEAEELVAVAALKRCGGDCTTWFGLHGELYDDTQERVLATLQKWAGVHLELAERLVRASSRQVGGRIYDRAVRPIREAVPRRRLGPDFL